MPDNRINAKAQTVKRKKLNYPVANIRPTEHKIIGTEYVTSSILRWKSTYTYLLNVFNLTNHASHRESILSIN